MEIEKIKAILIVIAIFICIFWIPKLIRNFFKVDKTKEFERGYKSALGEINKGKSPQMLYDQSLQSWEFDKFDSGWQTACIEKGAVEKDLTLLD